MLPRLDASCVQLFLDEFAKEHAPEGQRIVLVWDGAPAHRAHSLQVPDRITLISLPAYTPELNPSERVWPLVKEGVANQAHESLDELAEGLFTLSKDQCRRSLGADKLSLVACVMSHLSFHCNLVLASLMGLCSSIKPVNAQGPEIEVELIK